MQYLLKNLRLPVQAEQNLSLAFKKLFPDVDLSSFQWQVIRRALDTRKSGQPYYVYTLEIESELPLPKHPDLVYSIPQPENELPATYLSDNEPFIIGTGPAGLFCALALAEKGFKPHLFERGDPIEVRAKKVSAFWKDGILDPESNVQFGEGGAGTFSDGKLTCRSRNKVTNRIFNYLVKFGAPESIKWEALPHLGTDGIRQITVKIRDYLIRQGCRIEFNSKLERIRVQDNKVQQAVINGKIYQPEILILALGNSARDTYRMLFDAGVHLEPKNFAVGLRISHPQDWINSAVYGKGNWEKLLGPASYRLTAPHAGLGTYTFCMCPGGLIISASSLLQRNVTNGMSYSARDFAFGNSAIVTNINEKIYGSELFASLNFQETLETAAFLSKFAAPYQTASDFLKEKISNVQNVQCLFPSAEPFQLKNIFPTSLNPVFKQALIHFDHIMPGFIEKGLLIAPETRTSAPLRIIRDKINHNCMEINNLYAIGEGAGYAGGIISSASDGYSLGNKFVLK